MRPSFSIFNLQFSIYSPSSFFSKSTGKPRSSFVLSNCLFTNEDVKEIRHRFEWQKKAGLAVEHLRAEDARKIEPFISPDVYEALLFPNDWQVENRKLQRVSWKVGINN